MNFATQTHVSFKPATFGLPYLYVLRGSGKYLGVKSGELRGMVA